MDGRGLTPWFSYVGRSSTLTHFLVACLSSGAAARLRFACWRMTARDFGWRKNAFPKEGLCGGPAVPGRHARSRRIKHSYS
jgi:hypothetical protein